MFTTRTLVACAGCSRRAQNEEEAERIGWRYWFDGRSMHLLCGLCNFAITRLTAAADGDQGGNTPGKNVRERSCMSREREVGSVAGSDALLRRASRRSR